MEAILQTHPALERKLTAGQIGILEEAEAARPYDVQVGVHSLIRKAKRMVYGPPTQPREISGALWTAPCRSSVQKFNPHPEACFVHHSSSTC